MPLSNKLVSEFAKIINDNKKSDSGTIAYGKIVVDKNGQKYVRLDGSDVDTPITEEDDPSKESSTTDVKNGDRVSALIQNHTVTVLGNISSPAARTTDVKKMGIVLADKIQTEEAYFKKLIADEAILGELEVAEISVMDLIAKKAELSKLISDKITVTDLIAKKIDASVVEANYATIENLETNYATIENLETNYTKTESLDAEYANIDFANIGEAAVKKIFTDYGIIKELVVSEGYITKELIGVTIKGDLIEAKTLKADRLVVKGSDGIYYKLNVDSGATTSEKVSEEDLRNGLHGDAIIADTITANKIHVEDLVSFDATIGGFHITNDSIYSGVKTSSDSPAIGVYQGSDGQFAVGDDTNFLKFYKDEDGNYKLAVQASEIYLSSSGKNVEQAIDDTKSGIDSLKEDISENGVSKVITKTGYSFTDDGMIVQKNNNPEMKTQITDNGMMVYKKTGFETNSETPIFTPTLTANNKGVDAVNLNASTYLIVGGRSRFQNYGSNRTGCFWIGN